MVRTIWGRFEEASGGKMKENKRNTSGKLYRKKPGKKHNILLNTNTLTC